MIEISQTILTNIFEIVSLAHTIKTVMTVVFLIISAIAAIWESVAMSNDASKHNCNSIMSSH